MRFEEKEKERERCRYVYSNYLQGLIPYWPPATLPHGGKAIALEYIHVDFTSFGTKPLPRRSS